MYGWDKRARDLEESSRMGEAKRTQKAVISGQWIVVLLITHHCFLGLLRLTQPTTHTSFFIGRKSLSPS